MPSPRQIEEALRGTRGAVRFQLVANLGRIRQRRLKDGEAGYYLDFRPYGRVYTLSGVPLRDKATARLLLERIRSDVTDDRSLEEVLTRYAPVKAKTNLVATWLDRWLEVRRRECKAESLSPAYLSQLEALCGDGERAYFRFFSDLSIHEINYGVLEDFSLWLADHGSRPEEPQELPGGLPGLPLLA